MTKHRVITGFMAVALLAAVTTGINIRSYWSSGDRAVASANAMSIEKLTTAAGKLATDEFDDQSVIYSSKR
ncbi:hypothetical protein ABIB83_004674 [Bradyrhizobium sp. I1.8.5]|uniref:hypothetical protein n=1 Tax=Bradyrhizobium sp. I1.8.5 TaxID=3156365 RepID=UPI0033983431